MLGMDRVTGAPITDEMAHIGQSITDILTTLVGTRIERRDYGSVLPLLIDQPLNDATLLRAYSASIIAINQWEDRVTIERITRRVDTKHPGRALFSLALVTDNGAATIDVNASGGQS